MADNVQWIRLKVGMFDGNSFKKIKRAKIGGVSYRDKLTAIWFELLDLAGKCNSNGYLIDNNEIPYQSYEDIATMLDRDEKEIELCMQFFIKERMIEIIEDVYCLTNFMQYQNQDGLEKIREKKRISQAKWRERKKQGLIGKNVETTVEATSILPSNSNSYSTSIHIIFDYWNSKGIIIHKKLNEDIAKSIQKALINYTEEEIKLCIDRYDKILRDTEYFFKYKWSLKDLLNRKDGISSFTDEGSKWNSYQEFLENPKPTTKPTETYVADYTKDFEGVF
jgi:predicted phage replisome organizer